LGVSIVDSYARARSSREQTLLSDNGGAQCPDAQAGLEREADIESQRRKARGVLSVRAGCCVLEPEPCCGYAFPSKDGRIVPQSSSRSSYGWYL